MSLTLKIAGTVFGIGLVTWTHFGLIKPMVDTIKFDNIYKNALIQYADKDRDGFISTEEIDAFDKDLLVDKNVIFISGSWPRYANGRKVPNSIVTKWVEEYKPSK